MSARRIFPIAAIMGGLGLFLGACGADTPLGSVVAGPSQAGAGYEMVAERVMAPVRQRFYAIERPPEVIAEDVTDIADISRYAVTVAEGESIRGARKAEAAQIGLIYGSPAGRRFLETAGGRALVRGAPAEQCPSIEAAAGATGAEAASKALGACFSALAGQADCGCQVMALDDALLADRDDFAYAIAVNTVVTDVDTGESFTAIAEERAVEEVNGARRLWLLGPAGPVAMLQTAPDGRAALVFSDGGARYDGLYVNEGLRRGRFARRIFLTNESGRRLLMAVGFEPEEIEEDRASIFAWDGPAMAFASQ